MCNFYSSLKNFELLSQDGANTDLMTFRYCEITRYQWSLREHKYLLTGIKIQVTQNEDAYVAHDHQGAWRNDDCMMALIGVKKVDGLSGKSDRQIIKELDVTTHILSFRMLSSI